MAYDPLIGRPVIGKPNPELKRPTHKQNAMLAFAAGAANNRKSPRVTGTGTDEGTESRHREAS